MPLVPVLLLPPMWRHWACVFRQWHCRQRCHSCIDRGIVGNGLAVLLLDAPFANALLNGIVDQSLDDACQIAVSDCIPLTDVQQLGVRFSSVKNTLVLCFVSCYV